MAFLEAPVQTQPMCIRKKAWWGALTYPILPSEAAPPNPNLPHWFLLKVLQYI